MSQEKQNRVWVVTELYAPDDAATAHLLTQIAERASEELSVSVLCAQPTYTKRGQSAPSKEVRNGVQVIRCWSTTFSKDKLLLRMVNVLTIMLSFFFNMLFRFRRGDVVLVVTNPPPLPFATQLAATMRGAKTCLLIHDIYPDVLVPTGFTKLGSPLYRLVDFFNRGLFRRVKKIITIGRDMKKRVVDKSDSFESKSVVITNWFDESQKPIAKEANQLRQQLPFANKFIIQYSGNIGRTHGLSVIAKAAAILESRNLLDVHWMICGWGGGKAKFVQKCKDLNLKTVSIHEPYPREQLPELVGSADVSIISFIAGMSGISVPSRMYNILATGCPLIGVTESDSELALTISDDDLGWIVAPNDASELANLVQSIASQKSLIEEMRIRCRQSALEKFNRDDALTSYVEILKST